MSSSLPIRTTHPPSSNLEAQKLAAVSYVRVCLGETPSSPDHIRLCASNHSKIQIALMPS